MSLFKSLFSAIAMQALILAPTRELAQQIQKVVATFHCLLPYQAHLKCA